MTDKETKPNSKDGSASISKKSADITLGDQSYTIFRLKAGKFYDALKVYMSIVRDVAPKTSAGKGEAEVDMEKLLVSLFEKWPKQMVKFVAICCSTAKTEKPVTEELILETAYPEEVTKAFDTCSKLNNVTENLKNFVAPIGDLSGAKLGK